MKKLVIFDLDGTLVNTIDDLGAAVNHALKQLGYPTHQIASYHRMVGNGVTKLIARALPDDACTDAIITRAREIFTEYYDAHLADATRPYPGILELLGDLVERKIKIAVASNKYQRATSAIVEHFFGHLPWTAVVGQREGVPVKPDPSVVFEILNESPTPKADVLYVGDSGVDMTTAARACVESVGVTWGFRPRQDLEDNYADHIVSDPDEILSLI